MAVFNERGYEAASMEDLAKASGFTKSTFYHHVSGKEELLRMAVNRALDALSAALDETVEPTATARSNSWRTPSGGPPRCCWPNSPT